MTPSSAHVPGTGPRVRRLTVTLYGYAFLDDLVLLYPVYALLFADTGLSVGEISSLFVLWSLTGVLLEIPSGVWADTVSRRLLLCTGPLLGAVGFGLWVLFPSYWAFAAGFVLWGVHGALGTGALEALVYEELDRLGAAGRYARVMGRSQAAALLGVMAAMALAGPVLARGGYGAVGLASVLACLLTSAVATRFPEHRDRKGGRGAGSGDRAAALRAGLAEARGNPPLRGALLLVPAVAAVWGALDEYTSLLVRETGVADSTVPWLLLVVWAGATAGGLLAGAAEHLGDTGLAALLAGSALALAAGAAAGTPAALTLVALAFGGFQLAHVLADARLQQRIEGSGRATLTSVAGVGTELATIGVYGAYATAASATAHGTAFALFALPYLVTALLLVARRRRPGRPDRSPGRRAPLRRGGRSVPGLGDAYDGTAPVELSED
ncbi:MFS transporter [Streptomyces ruber]|uniref:MFS transporter n=2 Tax=Streptomyces TaxID=1883 RepID=A0A918BRL8_9ACTN|nr:MFS transporter [Streptomyces ruber]GGQ85782.1 MFS transporter [Streptomyces ruber]